MHSTPQSRAPYSMVCDAHPRPTKFLMPNGLTLWRTDEGDNKLEDAPEYKADNPIGALGIPPQRIGCLNRKVRHFADYACGAMTEDWDRD